MARIVSHGTSHVTISLGNGVEVTALHDGFLALEASALRMANGEPFADGHYPADVPLFAGKLHLSVNCYLVRHGGNQVLIDTGCAGQWGPSAGQLPAALNEASVDLSEIRTVVMTHMHSDHTMGLMLPDGSPTFPQLENLLIPRQEFGLLHEEPRLAAFAAMAEGYEAGQSIAGIVTVEPAWGHELGHSGFFVLGGEAAMLIWGDTVHVPSAQFADPGIAWEYDADLSAAQASRLRLYRLAAEQGLLVAGAHLDFPGAGYVRRDESGFRFEPV